MAAADGGRQFAEPSMHGTDLLRARSRRWVCRARSRRLRRRSGHNVGDVGAAGNVGAVARRRRLGHPARTARRTGRRRAPARVRDRHRARDARRAGVPSRVPHRRPLRRPDHGELARRGSGSDTRREVAAGVLAARHHRGQGRGRVRVRRQLRPHRRLLLRRGGPRRLGTRLPGPRGRAGYPPLQPPRLGRHGVGRRVTRHAFGAGTRRARARPKGAGQRLFAGWASHDGAGRGAARRRGTVPGRGSRADRRSLRLHRVGRCRSVGGESHMPPGTSGT
jgi:hypothetical protein